MAQNPNGQDLSRVVGQTRAVDGPRKFTCLGPAVQNRLASTLFVTAQIAAQPVTQGLTLVAPVDFVLNADYQGVYSPGDFPIVLTPVVKLFDTDVLGDPRVTYVLETDGVVFTELDGVVTITSVTKLTGFVRWLFSLDGVLQNSLKTSFTTVKADPPPPPVDAVSISLPVQNILSDQFVIIADFGPVRADNFNLTFVSQFVNAAGYVRVNSNCQVQVGIKPPGATSWTMLDVPVSGSHTLVEILVDDSSYPNGKQLKNYTVAEPGSVSTVFTFVIPTADTRVALFGKLTYGNPINFLSGALLET